MLLFAPEPRLLSRFARVHLLMPLQKLLKDLVGWLSWTSLGQKSLRLRDPRAEKAGPTLLTGMSNRDRETMRDIISAGRRDKS